MRPRGARTALAAVSGAFLLTAAACAPKRGTIGAVLAQKDDGRLFLRELPPGLAAERGGLRPDDEILLIDGRDVRAMRTEEVHQALSGEVGTAVKLTLLRGHQVIRVTLRRTEARKYPLPAEPASEEAPD
jgi:C-terminal processing protease CtpA/Prc